MTRLARYAAYLNMVMAVFCGVAAIDSVASHDALSSTFYLLFCVLNIFVAVGI